MTEEQHEAALRTLKAAERSLCMAPDTGELEKRVAYWRPILHALARQGYREQVAMLTECRDDRRLTLAKLDAAERARGPSLPAAAPLGEDDDARFLGA